MFNASSFNGLRNPFSPIFWQRLSEMAGVVGQLQSLYSEVATVIAEKKLRQREVFFPACIGIATPAPGGKPAWTYNFSEVQATNALTATAATSPLNTAEYDFVPGGRTGVAINAAESANPTIPAPAVYGTVVSAGGPPWALAAIPFTKTTIAEVPVGTIVFMRTALTTNSTDVRYEFWAPNPVYPACETPV